MNHHHNLIEFTGPADIVSSLFVNLELIENRFRVSHYILQPDTVKYSDPDKFRDYWELSNWGFNRDPVLMSSDYCVKKDQYDSLKMHIITRGGDANKIVAELCALYPRLHANIVAAVAQPYTDVFTANRWEYAHGKKKEVSLGDSTEFTEQLHELWTKHPINHLHWKAYAVLKPYREALPKAKSLASKFWRRLRNRFAVNSSTEGEYNAEGPIR